MATLTSTGLLIRRYPELFNLIKTSLQGDVSSELVVTEDTVLGQMAQIIANEAAILEEVLQQLNSSMSRASAEGVALDRLLYNLGIQRQEAEKSSGFVNFYTNENTTVRLGTRLRNPATGDLFEVTNPVTASKETAIVVDCEVEEPDGTARYYGVTVNGVSYNYTNAPSDGVTEVVTALANEIINDANEDYTASVFNYNGVDTLRIESKTNNALEVYPETFLGFTGISTERFTIRVPAEAREFGPIVAPEYSVRELVSGVGGVISLSNPLAFGTGRSRETDEELRRRASQSLSIAGSATYSALFTALRNAEGVSNLVLVENNTAATVGDLPPHSFEAIVDVPDSDYYNQVIANVIWNEKPIGISSYGTVNSNQGIDITDENGQTRTIFFSRPETQYIAIKVEYTVYDEEPLTENLTNVIKQAVFDYAQDNFTSGVDVIPRRFIGSVYSATSGLDSVTVYAQLLDDVNDTPVELDWVNTKLDITDRQTAVLDLSQIYVEVETP